MGYDFKVYFNSLLTLTKHDYSLVGLDWNKLKSFYVHVVKMIQNQIFAVIFLCRIQYKHVSQLEFCTI